MKSFFIFLFLIFLIPTVLAVGFSPSSITFNLDAGEESCETVTLDSNSETITVSDVWAENKDVEWEIKEFDSSASQHSLSIDYPTELSIDEREAEVCVSGTEEGEYHGAIIFRQEQEGNSVIQLAVWLKVLIGEQGQAPAPSNSGSGSSSGGGGGGGGGGAITTQKTTPAKIEEPKTENLKFQRTAVEEDKTEETVTQNTIEENTINQKKGVSKITILITIIFLIAIGLFLINRKKRQQTI